MRSHLPTIDKSKTPFKSVEGFLQDFALQEASDISLDSSSSLFGSTLDDDTFKARKIIFKQLSYSSKTRFQLEEKLREAEIDSHIISSELDRCEKEGYVNDRSYAHDWVKLRSENKSLGNACLRRELIQRGIDAETVEEALESREISEEFSARALVDKKMSSVHSIDSFQDRIKYKRRLTGLLERKGIPQTVSIKVIEEKINELSR